MRKGEEKVYVCPKTLGKLSLIIYEEYKDEVISGELVSEDGNRYPIREGVPDLTFPPTLPKSDLDAKKYYDDVADTYDETAYLTFAILCSDEEKVRNEMIDDLRLRPDHVVFEIGAGTGRDTVLIAKRLGKNGKIYAQDISFKVLKKCMEKMKMFNVPCEFSISNACYLPFPDRFFDAVFHFGGLNTFSDKKRAFHEINRVTKIGGRVVIGDEGVAPWLRETTFTKILTNSNPNYNYQAPLDCIPIGARDVRVRWIMGGAFYVIDYTVGEGEPQANFDIEIPGPRGGTLRTRYYGKLEGVKEETKKLAIEAAKKSGKSMHQWLDEVVREAAKRELERT